jgi:acetyltransferase-like isoleucine patch superfamily enzyme
MPLPSSYFQRLFTMIYRRVAPIRYARSIGVTVGNACRLINVSFSTEPYLVRIGDHVSATETRFETHDGGVWVLRNENPDIDIIRPIEVGSNVYFGFGCIVLPGVKIGDNVIIGAGSIVSRDIPSNSVAVGAPARVIKTIDEYRIAAYQKSESTKKLTLAQKRAFYSQKYQPHGD